MSLQIIGALTKRDLPQRTMPIAAQLVHTTGDQDLDKVLRYYESTDGLQPHAVIATDGTVYRTAMEDRVAWHAKIDPLEARLYQQGYQVWSRWAWPLGVSAPKHVGEDEFSGYRSWRQKWREGKSLQSPLDLVTGSHPNTVSLGVELQATGKPGAFTDAQYASLAELSVFWSAQHGYPLDADHVFGHQDVSPMRRSTASGGWDPGDLFNWNRLWDGIRAARKAGA